MKREIKVYDCCIYNSEFKMLNFRLHELNDVVDKFIVIEGKYTFKGDEKKREMLDVSLLPANIRSKVIHVVYDSEPDADPWANEFKTRDYCMEGLKDIELYTNDILMCSDVDEIPDTKDILKLKKSGMGKFSSITSLQNFYYYNIYTMKSKKFAGTRFTNVYNFVHHYNKSFYKMRVSPVEPSGYFGAEGDFNSGGWHFSYFGDEEFIIDKINSFSHQEYNTSEYKDREKIKLAIKQGKDVFFRGPQEDMHIDYNRTYLPKYVEMLKCDS